MTDVASLTLAIDSTQVDKGAASLDKLTAAGARTEAKTKDINASFASMPGLKSAASQMTFMSDEVQKLLNRYDPLGTKLRSLQSDFALLRKEMGDVYTPAVANAFKGLEDDIAKTHALMSTAGVEGFEKMAGAASKGAFATAGARRELIVLGHEVVSGNFSRIPGSLMVLAERTGASVGLMGGLAAAGAAVVGVLGYMAVKADLAERALNSLNRQFEASGNGMAVTSGQISGMVSELSMLPGVSKKAAEEAVASFARVPEIGNVMRANLLRLAPDIAAAFGVEIPKAAQLLAKSFATGEEGAKQLDSELNFLNAEQLITIHNLHLQGNELDIQKIKYDALKDRVKGLANEGLTPLEQSTNNLKTSWETLNTSFQNSGGLTIVRNALAGIVNSVSYVISHAGQFASAVMNVLPGGAGVNFLASNAPNVGQQSQSGKIGTATNSGAPSAGNISDNNLFIKNQLSVAEAYKGTSREISELQLKEVGLKKAQELLRQENQQGTETYKVLGEAISDIDKKIAALKRGRAGPKDDPAKNELEDQLRILEGGIQREKDLLSDRDKMLALYNGENLISFADYYAARKAAQEESLKNTLTLYDAEIADLVAHQAKTKRLTDKAADQIKIDAIKDKEARAQAEAAQQSTIDNFQHKKTDDAYARSIEEIDAKVKELTGDLKEAAGVNFDRQNKQLVDRFTTEGNTKALAQLDILKKYAIAQGEINDLKTKAKEIEQQEALVEARVNLDLETGAISQLDAMKRLSDARKQEALDLGNISAAMDKVAQSNNFPKITQEADQFKLKVEELRASADLLAKKFDTIFKGAIANFFTDVESRTKSLAQAFTDMADSIVADINRIIAQELAEKLYGAMGGGSGSGGFGGLLAGLFTGSGGGSSTAAASSNVASGISLAGMDTSSLFHFATGGSFMVGGSGATDTTPVQFMATRGEQVTVSTPAQQQQSNSSPRLSQVVHIHVNGTINQDTQKQMASKLFRAGSQAIRSIG